MLRLKMKSSNDIRRCTNILGVYAQGKSLAQHEPARDWLDRQLNGWSAAQGHFKLICHLLCTRAAANVNAMDRAADANHLWMLLILRITPRFAAFP